MEFVPEETGGEFLILCISRRNRYSGEPDAGNPHVRFDEGEGPGYPVPSLLYPERTPTLWPHLSERKVGKK